MSRCLLLALSPTLFVCKSQLMHTVHFLWTRIFSDPTSDLWGTRRIVSIWIEVSRQAAIPKGSSVKMTEKRPRSLPTRFTLYSQTARENEGCGLFLPKEAFIYQGSFMEWPWVQCFRRPLSKAPWFLGVCCKAYCTAHWRWNTTVHRQR